MPEPHTPAPGQESVWSYPRPAIAQPSALHIQIAHRGVVIADSRASIRTLETSHPPSYYIPPADIAMALLRPSGRRSFCEWKGAAIYYDVIAGGAVLRDVAWSYPDPSPGFASLRGHMSPSTPARSSPAWWMANRSRRNRAGSMAAGSPATSPGRSKGCRAAISGEGRRAGRHGRNDRPLGDVARQWLGHAPRTK